MKGEMEQVPQPQSPNQPLSASKHASALQVGWKVFAGLMILTILEYWVAATAQGPIPYPVLFAPLAPITWLAISISRNSAPYLGLLAVGKAFLILRYLMHVAQVWSMSRSSEGGH
jgi:hypothetical protein